MCCDSRKVVFLLTVLRSTFVFLVTVVLGLESYVCVLV